MAYKPSSNGVLTPYNGVLTPYNGVLTPYNNVLTPYNGVLTLYNGFWFNVFNATFNNISVISWWSVLLVEEIGVPRENH